MFTDNQKRNYMRMFFDGQPVEFYEALLLRLRLTNTSYNYLYDRYVRGLSDKEIARESGLSPYYVNKQIGKALAESYDALKNLSFNDYKATNQPLM